MSFCTVCFDATCPGSTGEDKSKPSPADHQRETQHEAADAEYSKLKSAVVAAGDAVVDIMSRGAKVTFFSTMQRSVDELAELRRSAFAAEPALQKFLPSSSSSATVAAQAKDVPTAAVSAADILAALCRVRDTISKRRKEFDKEQTASGSNDDDKKKKEESGDAAAGQGASEKDRALSVYAAALDAAKAHVQAAATTTTSSAFPFPWRLGYYVELKQSFLETQHADKKGVVNFEGGTITDANGDPLWDVCCHYCGIRVQQGAFGEGVKRVVRLNSGDQHSSCMECYEMLCRLEKALPAGALSAAPPPSSDSSSSPFTFAPKDPAMDIVETDEATMMRVAASGIATTHHIAHWLQRTLEVYAPRPALGWRHSSKATGSDPASSSFAWISYRQLHASIARLSNLLCSIEKEEQGSSSSSKQRWYVGISSMNRWEFVATDMAAAFSGWVSIGIHTTYTEEELADVLRHVALPVMVCDGAQLERFVRAGYETDTLRVILCMDRVASSEAAALHEKYHRGGHEKKKIQIISLADDAQQQQQQQQNVFGKDILGQAAPAIPPALTSRLMHPDVKTWSNIDCVADQEKTHGEDSSLLAGDSNLFSCIFTSGSSGSPKGVLHTERSFASDVGHALNIRPLCSLSFIPLSHSTDRMRVYETLLNGGRVAFVAYDHRNWLDHELATGRERFELLKRASVRGGTDNGVGQMLGDLWLLQPTVFISPPRVWKGMEFIFEQHVAMLLEEEGGSSGEKQDKGAADVEQQELRIRAEVAKRWKAGPFGRVVTCATGGGPTDESSFQFVRTVAGVPLVESYGATECGGIAMATSGDHRSFMEVMSGVDVRLLDEKSGEELDLGDASAEAGAGEGAETKLLRGEALIHTEHVAPGYLRNEEATRQTIVSRKKLLYFRSGDVVEAQVRQGRVVAVRVVDRKKNMFSGLLLSKISIGDAGAVSVEETEEKCTGASAEALESVATLLPGAMHAAAIQDKKNTQQYTIVVSVPSEEANTQPKPRPWSQEEKSLFARHSQSGSEATRAGDGGVEQCWLYPMPSKVIVDEGAGWTMSSANRKNGLLTVSSKVNRAAVARVFGLM